MSCLFDSISYFIKNRDATEVRDRICNYLESNKQLIDGLETKDILKFEKEDYVNSMRLGSTWGGAIEIQAACNIWKMRIIIINIRDKSGSIEFLPVSGDYKYTIELKWSGGHYTPVISTQVEPKREITIKPGKRDKIKIIVIGNI